MSIVTSGCYTAAGVCICDIKNSYDPFSSMFNSMVLLLMSEFIFCSDLKPLDCSVWETGQNSTLKLQFQLISSFLVDEEHRNHFFLLGYNRDVFHLKEKEKKKVWVSGGLWTWGTITTSNTLISTGKNHHSQLSKLPPLNHKMYVINTDFFDSLLEARVSVRLFH